MNAIEWAVHYVNADQAQSKDYGTWVPDVYHAQGILEHPRPAYTLDLGYLASRVRERRTVRRFGMVAISAESPLGFSRTYHFGGAELMEFNRASVWVHFDPMRAPVEATITLADDWQDHKAGVVIARGMRCLNSAPEMIRDDAGVWQIQFSDGIGETIRARRASRYAVRREMRAIGLDGNRVATVSTISAPDVDVREMGLGPVAAATEAAEAAVEEAAAPKIMSREMLAAS
jgi:hypothetical protein